MPDIDRPFGLAYPDYVGVERDVLQDNIILYDAKSGVLIAFAGLLILRSFDKAFEQQAEFGLPYLSFSNLSQALYFLGIAVFMIAILCAWQVIKPHIAISNDLVFWGSHVFVKGEEHYFNVICAATETELRRDVLHLLFVLAGICRKKAKFFSRATIAAELATGAIVLAEITRLIAHLPGHG